jgi:type IX secretion system PorP/SprF family membrane protein
MKKFTFLLAILLVSQAQAQFRPYSLYHLTPTLTNPANAAVDDELQVTANYRQSHVAAYQIPSLSFLYPFYERQSGRRYGGMGFTLINQASGTSNMFQITGALAGFAYDLQLGAHHHLATGLQLGLINKRIGMGPVTTDSQFGGSGFDPSLGNGEAFTNTSVSALGVNSGFTWYVTNEAEQQKVSLGLALYNMNQPGYQFLQERNREPVRLLLHGSWLAARVNNVSILPTFRLVHEARTSTANLGSLFEFSAGPAQTSKLGAGIWYNTNHSLGFNLQYRQEKFLIALGYDASTRFNSNVPGVNNAFEVALSYRLNRKKRLANRQTASPKQETGEDITSENGKEEQPAGQATPATPDARQETPVASEPETPAVKEAPQPAASKPAVPPATPSSTQPKAAEEEPTGQKEVVKPLTAEEKALFERSISFARGSTSLTQQDEQLLDSLATVLKQHPELSLKIGGHTCSLGSELVNEKISLQRAEKVKALMVQKGVPKKQLVAIGYGDKHPVASNATEAGRVRNRRVTFAL